MWGLAVVQRQMIALCSETRRRHKTGDNILSAGVGRSKWEKDQRSPQRADEFVPFVSSVYTADPRAGF